MSDPVTSMDVEDVLSSIRRLVSEEAKNAGARDGHGADMDIHQAAEDAADKAFAEAIAGGEDGDEPEGVPPSNEVAGDDARPPQKLVLTEALRVSEPEGSGDSDRDEPGEQSTRRERWHLRSVGADETAESIAGFTSRRSSAFEQSPEDFLFDRARRAMDGVLDEDDPSHAGEDGADPAGVEAANAWVSPFSDLGKILKPAGMQPAPDAGEMEAAEPESAEADHVELDEDLAEVEYQAETSRDEAQSQEASEDVSDQRDDPDRDEQDGDHSDISARNETRDQPDEHHEEVGESTDPQGEAETVNLVEEESILDEETLREMVSEMVREELQGELGDRITRNVRKLVRREIQRAIATREFE